MIDLKNLSYEELLKNAPKVKRWILPKEFWEGFYDGIVRIKIEKWRVDRVR